MARARLIREKLFPYHVTARSNNREAFPISIHECWNVFSSECHNVSVAYGAQINAFVLMPNHFHMLITTPDGNLDQIMRYFMTETGRRIMRKAGEINHCFGARYKWSVISNWRYYLNAYKYILRNPVSAGLCARVEEYPWSSIAGRWGQTTMAFPLASSIFDGYFSNMGMAAELSFLNQAHTVEQKESIRRALRRALYQPPIKLPR